MEQVRESRAAFAAWQQLHGLLTEYIARAKSRYPNNVELQETLTAIDYNIRALPAPTDKATYVNERYYLRFARKNDRAKARQALQRRMAGIPTREETVAEARIRAAEEQSYHSSRMQIRNRPPQPHQSHAPIMPRSFPDDRPLEFESQAEMLGQREENFPSGPNFGLDIPADPYDNGDT